MNLWEHARIRKITLAVGTLLVIVLIIFLFTSSRPPDTKHAAALKDLGFTLASAQEFTVTEEFGSSSEGDEKNIAAQRDGEIMRLQIASGASGEVAKRYTSGQFLLLNSQYDTNLPPYPEFLTNRTGCTERFLPQKRDASVGQYYLVHAGERFNYGLCADDLVRYRAGFGIFYCEAQKKLFQLEYFIEKERPWSDVDAFMSSFRCAE